MHIGFLQDLGPPMIPALAQMGIRSSASSVHSMAQEESVAELVVESGRVVVHPRNPVPRTGVPHLGITMIQKGQSMGLLPLEPILVVEVGRGLPLQHLSVRQGFG
jgi:hypothetical protein